MIKILGENVIMRGCRSVFIVRPTGDVYAGTIYPAGRQFVAEANGRRSDPKTFEDCRRWVVEGWLMERERIRERLVRA